MFNTFQNKINQNNRLVQDTTNEVRLSLLSSNLTIKKQIEVLIALLDNYFALSTTNKNHSTAGNRNEKSTDYKMKANENGTKCIMAMVKSNVIQIIFVITTTPTTWITMKASKKIGVCVYTNDMYRKRKNCTNKIK